MAEGVVRGPALCGWHAGEDRRLKTGDKLHQAGAHFQILNFDDDGDLGLCIECKSLPRFAEAQAIAI